MGLAWEVGAKTAWVHALEAKGQSAFHLAPLDRVVGLKESRGASRAVVVDVDNRDGSESKVVECTL